MRIRAATVSLFVTLPWLVVLADVEALGTAAPDLDGRTLRGGIPLFPNYLDPQLSNNQDGWMAMYNTYIPLLTYRHGAGKAGE